MELNLLNFLSIFAGIGLFVTGLNQIADSVQALAGHRMQSVVNKLSIGFFPSVFGGILLGLLTFSTSGAAFVCMGLVKSNIMSMNRVIPVLSWSSVGASLIILFGVIDVKFSGLILLCSLAFFDFSGINHSKLIKALMPILLAAGILFLGLGMIKEGANTLGESEQIKFIFESHQPFLIFMVGAIITFIVHTSTVSVAIAIIFNISGLISFNEALLLIFGADLGYGFGLYYHALHLENKNKRIALCAALVNFFGVIILYFIFLVQPNAFVWQFSEISTTQSVALNIYLVVLAIQITGALIISLLSYKVITFLSWYYPDDLSKTFYEPKFIYPEAVAHPSTAIVLARQEIDSLIIRLIDNLDPLRVAYEKQELANRFDGHDSIISVTTKISSFIEQVALKNNTNKGIEKIFKLRAKNELVALTQKSLNDFSSILMPIIKSKISLVSSMVEGLHIILMLLNEAILENDDCEMLLELTSEKSELMENIRKSLASDHSKSILERQSLLIATGIFERIIWLVRQLALTLIDEKNEHYIKSN